MSKKKLLEFGLKEADAFQKNFKIIFDRLVRGYRSMMGKEPEGLDLLKVKMEAREKALNTTKVVNQKGLTLDPNKPIVGGTQEGIETIQIKELDEFNLSKDDPMGDLEKIVKGEGDTGLPKNYTRPFGDNIRDAYGKAGRSREEATEMVEALNSPGAKQSYEVFEEALGVRLYGDETFEELMKIKETGVHPRGEPPLKKADGGQVPAAPSQLVSESDMILGYRGPGGYQGGGGNKSSGGNKSGGGGNRPNMADVAGPVSTPSSVSTPQDLGFIESTTTFTPDPARGPTGTTIVGPGPKGDGPGAGYVMSTTPPTAKPSFLDNIINTGTNIINNPIARTLGLVALTTINPTLAGKVRRGMMAKGMLEAALADIESAPGEVIESMSTGTDVTGNTTALYKDGGLVTLFTEKR
jgi:hypothetical protein